MKYVMVSVLSAMFGMFLYGQATRMPQGAMPFTPTRIDWLTTTLQASLRDDRLDSDGFMLQITAPDPDTILIYVRYTPTVRREIMNTEIEAARKVIEITAKGYKWDWVKIREDLAMVSPPKG